MEIHSNIHTGILKNLKRPALKALFLLVFLLPLSCDKETIDDLFLTDGMLVFNLNGKDWILKDVVASFSDLSGIGQGQTMTIAGSVEVNLNTYKTVNLIIKDTETIRNLTYNFTGADQTGSKIIIDEGKTDSTGFLYNTAIPGATTTGKIVISNFDKISITITGSLSGEIFRAEYTGNNYGEWKKTSIKSGRFSNVPVIYGK